VILDGIEVKLKPNEYSLLEFFMRNQNKTFSSEMLLDRVWSADSEASVDSVYVCINRLRKKLGRSEDFIRTIHGIGYQMTPPD
jgi:DNA-binding response OmpR family regulator